MTLTNYQRLPIQIPAILLILFAGVGRAQVSIHAQDQSVQFNRDVRPILSDKCFACHGFDAKKRQAGLRLDTSEGALAKLESGHVAIHPGSVNESELWRRITSDDPAVQMPPADSNKTLTREEKETLRRWIEQRAPYQKHWAFEPPVRPPVPTKEPSRLSSNNPIDAFIDQKLSAVGLSISPVADRATLLRRLSIDLIGLPPTIDELDAFLQDQAADAYEKQVHRLLSSPHFGEKMAARWLDLSRYGDTSGYLHDLKRSSWPWRDWLIRSFNENKPFDQFVIEQLAGDLLPSATPDQILATAFLRNHPITSEGGTLAAEYLNEYSADRVQTFGTAFLGLSLNCCRCHDHKFDPLSMEDFYSLQAYFNSITEKHSENNTAIAYVPFVEIASPLDPSGEKAKVMIMEEAPNPTATFVLTRGQYDRPDQARPVDRRTPIVLETLDTTAPKNRLGLAQWTVSAKNTLLPRVTVNRIWQGVFGTGLVKTVDEFGVQGEYPSHPELLDFLAVEFRDGAAERGISPWNVKHLIELIVTSAMYRQSSKVTPALLEKDPENRLLGRFPRQRLTAEEIRDQALYAAGLLSPKMGGPATFPYQPDGIWEERANEGSNTKVFVRSEGEALFRRSLYTFWKRTCPPPLMSVFDAPDRLMCLAQRSPTNTPLQALAAMNDEQMLECAKMLAARTLAESNDRDARIIALFRRATGRTPASADLQTIHVALDKLLARFRAAPDDADQLLRQGITSPPDRLDKPELAAWMLLASAVLNLDESLVRD